MHKKQPEKRPLKTKWLPPSVGGKMAAIFGHLVAAIGVYASISYFLMPLSPCKASNKVDLTVQSIMLGVVQGLVVYGLVRHIRSLNQHDTASRNVSVVLVSAVVLVVQIMVVAGFAFGVGTACTT